MFPGKSTRIFTGAGPAVAVMFVEEGDQELSTTAFGFQAMLGARFFIGESLSIDPTIGGSFLIGSGELSESSQSLDLDVSGFGGGLLIGLSGWI